MSDTKKIVNVIITNVSSITPEYYQKRRYIYEDDENGWTIYTEDGKPSAQWEIQVLVTEDGYEILSY